MVIVNARVKPEHIEGFKRACLENARHSLNEEGLARFDVVQQQGDPARFVLLEVYRDDEAPARHKETAHYAAWRDTVAEMIAEPRVSVRRQTLFPPANDW